MSVDIALPLAVGSVAQPATSSDANDGYFSPPVTYGKLIVLGTNGGVDFTLKKRRFANGHQPVAQLAPRDTDKALMRTSAMTCLPPSEQNMAVQFRTNENTDSFQIGRAQNDAVDFTVPIAVGNDRHCIAGLDLARNNAAVWLSRYACRIEVDRDPPHTARLYAGGFDENQELFLRDKAHRWLSSGVADSTTTNGVLLSRPISPDSERNDGREWFEVSVLGNLYERIMFKQDGHDMCSLKPAATMATNELVDGSLIDLCAVTLLYRSAGGLENLMPTRVLLALQAAVNVCRPFCPVGLQSLNFEAPAVDNSIGTVPLSSDSGRSDRQPYCHLGCGHVTGREASLRGADNSNSDEVQCVLCNQTSKFVALKFGQETAFYRGSDLPLCAFQCGHVTTYSTAKYWGTLKRPNNLSIPQTVCPFCRHPLNDDRPFVRLIFQILDEPK